MRYHLFLQYGWFLQNLGKDFIPTNMHTTVDIWWTAMVFFIVNIDKIIPVFIALSSIATNQTSSGLRYTQWVIKPIEALIITLY
jgi:hypothetical protein